jgi:hypothetical protein
MKKNLILVATTLITLLAISATASAQVTAVGAQQGLTTFAGLITTFNNTVVKALATLFLSGAVVAFFFGVAKFIWGLREGKSDAITNGKQFMIWSLIGLFVMFSVYGIIRVAQSLVPGLNSSTITVPDFNMGGNGLGSPTSGGSTGGNGLGAPSSGGGTGSNTGGSGLGAPTTGGRSGASTGNNISSFVGGTQSTGANTGGTGAGATFQGGDGGCGYGYTPSESGNCVSVTTGAAQPAGTANSNGVCPSGYTADDSAASGCSPIPADNPPANCTVDQGC